MEREEKLIRNADRFLLVDTDARTTRIFSLYYHGCAHPRLDTLAQLASARCDRVFL